jgi:gas vesicle protein
MDGQERGSGRLRSFVLGGLVGASAALAAAKRKGAQRRQRRTTPVGLAAFEEAPCYGELVEREERLGS